MTTEDFITRLQGVVKVSDGWMARCPAHDDNKQSLHISLGADGRVLLKCFAGCKTEQVVKLLGLSMPDLFKDKSNGTEKKVAVKVCAKYDYFDERGHLLFQVVRKEPKGFYQRHPDTKGGWVNNMTGIRRVLYRLPQLLASDVTIPVLVVEGEKDVETAYSLDVIATTSPMGVGKWRDEYAESLRNRHVVLVPDNDKAGHEHMRTIADSLSGRAASVRWLELPGIPTKGDLSDWVSAGGTRTELDGLIANATARNTDSSIPESDEPTPVPTDDELRDRWLIAHPNTAFGFGEYRRYENGYWPVIPKEQVQSEIVDILEGAKGEKVRPGSRLLSSVLELARIKIFLPDTKWDSDPDLLVFTNGTLNLVTRVLHEHNPSDHITIALQFPYDPTSTCPMWDYFIETTIPNEAEFFQEFAGYALTTDVRYEIAVWLVGERGSGKSTGIGGLDAMLGPKVCRIGLSDIEKSRFALGSIPGKTLAIAMEQPSIFIKSSHILNALISGESIKVENKFENSYDFTPKVKILWAMNDLPRVSDATDGLFRRVKVIKFPPALPEEQRDPEVKIKISEESAGILNWALVGLDRLRARGKFEIPMEVKQATEEFKSTNDVTLHFVKDMCVVGPDLKVKSSVLYTAYHDWCIANGHGFQSSTAMAGEWERLKFVKYTSNGRAYIRGVELVGQLPE